MNREKNKVDIKLIKATNRMQAQQDGKFHAKVIGNKKRQKLDKVYQKESRDY